MARRNLRAVVTRAASWSGVRVANFENGLIEEGEAEFVIGARGEVGDCGGGIEPG